MENIELLPTLALLAHGGVIPAVPLVTQWLYDLFPRLDDDNYKIRIMKSLLPIPIGVLLGLLYATITNNSTVLPLYLIIIDGGVAGAMGSAGVSLASKLISKAS